MRTNYGSSVIGFGGITQRNANGTSSKFDFVRFATRDEPSSTMGYHDAMIVVVVVKTAEPMGRNGEMAHLKVVGTVSSANKDLLRGTICAILMDFDTIPPPH